MMMLDGRRCQWHWRQFSVQVERMAAFHHAPTVIVALVHKECLFPQILPILTDPNVAGLRVGGYAPGIAQAYGPRFGASFLHAHERIVFGHGVSLVRIGMIDV